jgi:hypothetical protein
MLAKRYLSHLCGLLMFFFCAGSVHASSSGSWEEFQADLQKKCSEKSGFKTPYVLFADYGTASFGVALVYEKARNDLNGLFCVYDKATQIVEVSGEVVLPFLEKRPAAKRK